MKNWIKMLLIIAATMLCVTANAVPTVTATLDKTQVKSGEIINATAKVTNTDALEPKIVLTAWASYTTSSGEIISSTITTLELQVIHPISVTSVVFSLPLELTYVDGSAKVKGTATTPTLGAGIMTIPIGVSLFEQESLDVVWQYKAK